MKRKPRGSLWDINYFMQRSIINETTGCWEWKRATQRNGYGVARFNGKTVRAHRLAYEIANGQRVSPSLDVCHHCDNRACVNPDHLFAGTRADNMQDCAAKKRLVMPHLYGEMCPASKLSEDDVRAIRSIRGISQREIGRRYNVDKGTIAHILHRKTWRHI